MIAVGPFQCRIFYDSVLNTYIHTQYTYSCNVYCILYIMQNISMYNTCIFYISERDNEGDEKAGIQVLQAVAEGTGVI